MEEENLKVDFPSEGVLNLFSGLLICRKFGEFLLTGCGTSGDGPMTALLFFAKPSTQKSFSTWQISEILSRFIFLHSFHSTPPMDLPANAQIDLLNMQLFAPRLMKSFLEQMVSANVVNDFLEALGSRFEGCYTHFGYFQEADEAVSPGVACRAMLYRGCGRYLPRNHPGADFMLPLVLQNGRYGLVLVQVKGVREDLLEPRSNTVVIKAMEKCSIFGVFGMNADDLRLGQAEKKRRLELQRTYKSFPVIRILINLSNVGGNGHNGSRVFNDGLSPVLIIQTTGDNMFKPIPTTQNSPAPDEYAIQLGALRKFSAASVAIAIDAVEGKLPKYLAQRRDPPIDLSSRMPYNPVFRGILHDNDRDVFRGGVNKNKPLIPDAFHLTEEQIRELLESRPSYLNLPE
jgi:hypothetical protein